MARVFNQLTDSDLQEMRIYASLELCRFLRRAGNPPGKFGVLQNNLIAICLCQGAAQHYVEGMPTINFDSTVVVTNAEIQAKGFQVDANGRVLSGVKDIDIWLFFEEHSSVRIPDRGNCRFHHRTLFFC